MSEAPRTSGRRRGGTHRGQECRRNENKGQEKRVKAKKEPLLREVLRRFQGLVERLSTDLISCRSDQNQTDNRHQA